MQVRKGLSLIGIIIATAVISGAMVSFLTHQNQLQKLQFEQEYAMLGNLLASEGVELARGVRDTNFLSGNIHDGRDWYSGLSDGEYNVDYDMELDSQASDGGFNSSHNSVRSCPDGDFDSEEDDCRLMREDGKNFYTLYDSTEDEVDDVEMYRQIKLESDNSSNPDTYITVTSRVKIVGKRSGNEQAQYTAVARLYKTDVF